MRSDIARNYTSPALRLPWNTLSSRLDLTDVGTLRWGAFLLVLLVAVFLRTFEISRVGLNSDEAVYAGQAAALLGDADFEGFFSVFRAHPLLLQTSLAVVFSVTGVEDYAARLFVALVFGVGSVVFTYLAARKLYGFWVAIVASTLLAVMPYHVLVSRQVLVDMPLAFFVAMTIWFLAMSTEDDSGKWIILAGFAAGLASISKGFVGIFLLPIMVGLMILTGEWRRFPFRILLMAFGLFAVIFAPFIITRLLFAPVNSASYFVWQVLRTPNHSLLYFFQVLVEFASPIFVTLALVGIVQVVRRRSRGDILILLWLAIYLVFFHVWPTKLFQYISVVAPGLSIVAGIGFVAIVGRFATSIRTEHQPRIELDKLVLDTASDVRQNRYVESGYRKFIAFLAAAFVLILPVYPRLHSKISPALLQTISAFVNPIKTSWRAAKDFLLKPRELSPRMSLLAASGLLLAVTIYLGYSSWTAIMRGPEGVAGTLQFDIEVQDFAGGREVGLWARDNTPTDARFMTIGPSMGNIIRFYGQRETASLSVSSNPRKRNPAYVPISNPDLLIRNLGLHYVVWDAYSADRSAFYNARLMRYVRKYDGVPVYAVYQRSDGTLLHTMNPSEDDDLRVIVFDVHGGGPLNTAISYPFTNFN